MTNLDANKLHFKIGEVLIFMSTKLDEPFTNELNQSHNRLIEALRWVERHMNRDDNRDDRVILCRICKEKPVDSSYDHCGECEVEN